MSEEKELTAAEKREAGIRQRMQGGNMTRENAEMVIDHQEAEDAKRKKKAATEKPGGKKEDKNEGK